MNNFFLVQVLESFFVTGALASDLLRNMFEFGTRLILRFGVGLSSELLDEDESLW